MKQTRQAKKPLQNNNSHLKNRFIAALSASILAMSLTASTCGTFAWFTYATRAGVIFDGVTIGAGTLQVGFVSKYKLPSYETYYLEEDLSIANKYIYWVNGNMNSSMINYVLSQNGYATTTMNAVSSGFYAKGDSDFSLYSAPAMNVNSVDIEASKRSYVHLELVFRYEDDLEPGIYIPDTDIYLSGANVTSLTNIHNAVRIFSSDINGNKYHLINPTQDDDGSNKVGGILDLDGDGYFDSHESGGDAFETFYGEFEGDPVYQNSPLESDSSLPEEERTTFDSRHRAGVFAANMNQTTPKKAEYEGFSKFKNKQTSVSVTDSKHNNYAYLNLDIFLEGWDFAVIEAEKNNPFNLDLKFEVVI